jgi:CheY-like chemotaxis protein
MTAGSNKKYILSIDDDPIFRDIIRNDLEKLGFEFEFFGTHDAKSGIKMASEMAMLNLGPDLIICDWNMPEVSGLEFFKAIKLNPDLKKIPFLMITTVKTKVEILRAMQAGIRDYIIKPWKFEDFQLKVKKILNLN